MSRLAQIGIAAVVALAALPATAQDADNPIVKRQNVMKSVGAAAGVGGGMLRKQIPYDANVGALVLATFSASGHVFGDYFPEDSKQGNKTEAAPAIWEDRAGFDAELAKYRDAAKAAFESKPADLEAFQKAFVSVAQSCKSCHTSYRVSIN